MEQYIKKSDLVAEIKRRQKEHDEKKYDYASSDHFWAFVEDGKILSLIDTLEVKEEVLNRNDKTKLMQKCVKAAYKRGYDMGIFQITNKMKRIKL